MVYWGQTWIQAAWWSVSSPHTKNYQCHSRRKARLENKEPCEDCSEKIKAPVQGCSAGRNHTFGEEFPHNAMVKDQRLESRVCSSTSVWRGCFIILWLITTQSLQRKLKRRTQPVSKRKEDATTIKRCDCNDTDHENWSYFQLLPQGLKLSAIQIKAPENVVSNCTSFSVA